MRYCPSKAFVGPAVMILIGLTVPWACGGDGGPTGPTAGVLEASLTTPNLNDAAVVFRINGPSMGTVTASDPGAYMHVVDSGSSITVVLVGDLLSGSLVRFSVPDIGEQGSYQAILLEVADDSNELRGTLDGYQVTVQSAGG